MQDQNDNMLRIALSEARDRLIHESEPFVVLFRRAEFPVELYAPRGTDQQLSHDQDEAYIVASGAGRSVEVRSRAPFQPGDFLFVAAGVPHRFEEFTEDFQTWV